MGLRRSNSGAKKQISENDWLYVTFQSSNGIVDDTYFFQTRANYCCANSPHDDLANTPARCGPQTMTMGAYGGLPRTGDSVHEAQSCQTQQGSSTLALLRFWTKQFFVVLHVIGYPKNDNRHSPGGQHPP